MRRILVSSLLVLTVATPVHAETIVLSGEALRQLATNQTVLLQSPYGTLPVSFRADGTLSGQAKGSLATYLGSPSDNGRWSVKGDRICQKFFRWFAGETHCLRVRQNGARLHWQRDDGLTGTATIAGGPTPVVAASGRR